MSRRVLHVLSQRPLLTGSGITLDALVRRGAAAGWEQKVVFGVPTGAVTADVGGLTGDALAPLFFDNDVLPFSVPGMSDTMPYRSTRWSDLSTEQLEIYERVFGAHIASVVDEFRPDIVHGHHLWIVGSRLADWVPDTPIVSHSHGTALRQLDLCPHLAASVVGGCVRNHRVLALHKQHRADIIERYGFADERVVVVGAGYRADLFHTDDRGSDEPRPGHIVYAGKLATAKGLPWLLDAFAELAKKHDAVLHVAGSGGNKEADDLAGRAAAIDGVVLHGRLGQDELAQLMRRATVFVLPSLYEGMPLVLVEALASGCRLVATDLPGVLELSPQLGDRLRLVPTPRRIGPDTPVPEDLPAFVTALKDALAAAIADGVAPPPDRDELRPLSWDAVYDRVEAVWQQLLAT